MSYTIKDKEIVIEGWENGIAASPHRGLANIKNANISTETGEVMASFARTQQAQTATTGSLTQVNTNTVSVSAGLLVGQRITITNAGTTGLSGNYYYLGNGKLFSGNSCPSDPDNATVVTGITSGTATYSVEVMGSPLQSATEVYLDSNGVQQARYFILDSKSIVWCHDSKSLSTYPTPDWFFVTDWGSGYTGMAVYNGWLVGFKNTATGSIQSSWRCTSTLGSGTNVVSLALSSSSTHVCLVGHQGKLYVTDGNYIASYFANTSLITGAANVQSYCEYSTGTDCNIVANIGGSLPTLGQSSTVRIPVTFQTTGTKPTAVSASNIFYLESSISGGNVFQFKVYAAASGGAALDMVTGATGRQFFNTFNPSNPTLFTFTPQRVNLPFNETAKSLVEIGNTVLIGGSGNVIYPWDQISPLPADVIPLPENDIQKMITVNNVAYVFAGHKGNIYITNGSSVSPAVKVPDYCAGIAGTPASYIEPYFSWGDAMYCRGRVYFSILDQTATKTGNCGGIWSFVPNQNFFSGQDVGLSLRLENQNSYGTYNGVATVLINSQTQTSIGPQYWAAWYSSITSPTYGIDFSASTPVTTVTIESDLIPTGTMLQKKSFAQLEYKLSTPFAANESLAAYYRLNSTDAWTTCGSANTETSNVSGYFTVPFQNTQWVQIQVIMTTTGDSTSSFCRLKELRLI